MLTPVWTLVIAFLAAAIAAALLIRILIVLRQRTTSAAATMAGAVLLPAMAIGVVVVLAIRLVDGTVSDTVQTSSFIMAVALLIVYLAGIIEDLLPVRRWQRNLFLLLVCAAFPTVGLYINDLHGLLGIHAIGYLPGFIVTVIFSLLVVKGIEKLGTIACLTPAIASIILVAFTIAFAIIARQIYATIAIALMGAVMVYLRYDARGDSRLGTTVQLGFSGALIIGFGIIYESLKYAMDNTYVMDHHADAILLPYSLTAIIIFEYLRVLLIGLWQGLDSTARQAHHIHSILLQKGFTLWQTIAIIIAAECVIVAINLCLHHLGNVNITWVILMNIVIYVVLVYTLPERHATPVVSPADSADHYPNYHGIDGLVSIIMPTYNSSAFVAQSIDSILAQTYTHWELLITDDCSTDDTMVILQRYAQQDARIHILSTGTNGGAGVARNTSIAQAQGQYIAFCDSDDRWTNDKLQRQIAFMQAHDIALAFAPYYTCDENNQYLGYVSAPQRVGLFAMMCDNKIGFLTCIYDTHHLGKHNMPRQRKRQDHAMLLTLLRQCHYAYSLPQPLAFYRLHPGTLSNKKVALIKYNAQTYIEVFGWNKAASYTFLFTVFLPCYFAKKAKNIIINATRAA